MKIFGEVISHPCLVPYMFTKVFSLQKWCTLLTKLNMWWYLAPWLHHILRAFQSGGKRFMRMCLRIFLHISEYFAFWRPPSACFSPTLYFKFNEGEVKNIVWKLGFKNFLKHQRPEALFFKKKKITFENVQWNFLCKFQSQLSCIFSPSLHYGTQFIFEDKKRQNEKTGRAPHQSVSTKLAVILTFEVIPWIGNSLH